jgi:alkylhydroperoxidase family enzyme
LALLCLTGYQVTGDVAAPRMLGRLGAALVELDRWLPAHADDLALRARDRPRGMIELNDLPIDVSIAAAAAVDADEAGLRELIVDQMGEVLYRRGTDAFRDNQGNRASLGLAEPVRWTVVLLESEMHARWQAALLLGLLLLVAAVAALLASGSAPFLPVALGAGMAAVASLAAWLLAQAAASLTTSLVDREILLMLREGAWIGLRNSLAVLLAAGSLVLLLATLGGQRYPRRLHGGEERDAGVP